MTDDTKPTPQRIQPKSKSPMADGAAAPAPKRPPGRPPRQATAERAPMTAPTENQLEAMRPPEEQTQDPIGNEPVREAGSHRVPFGNQEAKMAVPEREGFTRRYFNDEPGRVARALRAGYVHVMDQITGKPIEMIVTRSADKAGGMRAFCMEIPNEFYDEDFARKQEALDIVDLQIYTGTNNEEPGDNRYVPRNTMNMRVKHGRGSHLP